jgi:iron complex outermembrane receptor protein
MTSRSFSCKTRKARLPLNALGMAIALAATTPLHAAVAADATPSGASRSYAIAPGSLGNVLAQFAVQSGVLLSFDARMLNDRQSAGLAGDYSVQEGFARLLQGSGFMLMSTGDNSYTVSPQVETGAALELGATTVTRGNRGR